jgi:low temperature requirement protein LtrA
LRVSSLRLSAAAFTIAAAFLPPAWRWTGWLAAVLCFVALTVYRRERGFQVNAAHFGERHGLVIIIAIGESVISLGSSIGDVPIT